MTVNCVVIMAKIRVYGQPPIAGSVIDGWFSSFYCEHLSCLQENICYRHRIKFTVYGTSLKHLRYVSHFLVSICGNVKLPNLSVAHPMRYFRRHSADYADSRQMSHVIRSCARLGDNINRRDSRLLRIDRRL
jgi:hypothetical protein